MNYNASFGGGGLSVPSYVRSQTNPAPQRVPLGYPATDNIVKLSSVNSLPWCEDIVLQDIHPIVKQMLPYQPDSIAKIASTSSDTERPVIPVAFNGLQVQGLVDTGAGVCCIEASKVDLITPRPSMLPSSKIILDAKNRIMDQLGKFKLTIEAHGAIPITIDVYAIFNLGTDAILGWDYQQASGMIINAKNNTISFHGSTCTPINAISSHTLRAKVSAVSAATPLKGEQIPYLVESTNDIWLYPQESKYIYAKVATPRDIDIKMGTTVLIESDPISDIYAPDAILTARSNSTIRFPIRNNGPRPMKLRAWQPIPGITAETVDESSIMEATEEILTKISAASTETFEYSSSNSKDSAEIPEVSTQIPPISPEKRQYLLDNFSVAGIDPEFVDKYVNWVLDNHDVFSSSKFDLGLAKGFEHEIFLKDDNPVYVPQFKIPHAHQPVINEWVKQMLRAKVIEPSRSPYNSPIFLVPKKGGALRLVQDLRGLNSHTHEDRYSIRDVRESLNAAGVAGNKLWACLDSSNAFWQISLSKASRPYTAFTIPFLNQQFQWTRAAQGLRGIPSSYSRFMGVVMDTPTLKDSVITYVDDVLVGNKGHEGHIATLTEIAQRCRKFGIKLNVAKCFVAQRQIDYLGHKLTPEGVTIEDAKAEAVKALKPPNSIKKVMEVCGLFNYFRALIKDFSLLIQPLTNLTCKDSGWKGGELPEPALRAFLTLQTLLCQRPVIAHPIPGKPYILCTDASHGEPAKGKKPAVPGGLSGILSQVGYDGVERVISYWSRGLKNHEINFPAYSLEKAALVNALEFFHQYVKHVPVTAFVDHKPLVAHGYRHAQTLSTLQERLNEYDVTLKYREGSKNSGPDCLSRNAVSAMSAVAAQALVPHTSASIAEAQARDPTVVAFKNFLNKQEIPTDGWLRDMLQIFAPKAIIRDGLVYLIENRKGSGIPKARLWVPKELRQSVISSCHDPTLSGHWGTARTTQKVLQDYIWPSVAVDVDNYIEKCPICFKKKDLKAKKATTGIIPWPQARGFNDRVHCDLVGPFRSNTNNKYILCIIDAYSKWVEIVAIPDKKATTVAWEIFKNWICRYSVPSLFITDNGKEFANQVLDELFKLFQAKHHTVNVYSPRSNGQIEKFNSSLRSYLLAYVDDDTLDWEKFLPPLAFAHNNSVSASTNMTPFYALFTHDPTLPWALTGGGVSKSNSDSSEMFRNMLEANKIIRESNGETRRAYEAYIAQKTKDKVVNVGDKVLLHDTVVPPNANKKLWRPWKAGYRVAKVLDFNTALLVRPPDTKEFPVTLNRIRLFNEFRDPTSPEVDMSPPGQPPELPQVKKSPKYTKEVPEKVHNTRANAKYHAGLANENALIYNREELSFEETGPVAASPEPARPLEDEEDRDRSLNASNNDDTTYFENIANSDMTLNQADNADNLITPVGNTSPDINNRTRSFSFTGFSTPTRPASGPSNTSTPLRVLENTDSTNTVSASPEEAFVSTHSNSKLQTSNGEQPQNGVSFASTLAEAASRATRDLFGASTASTGNPAPQERRTTRYMGIPSGRWTKNDTFKR